MSFLKKYIKIQFKRAARLYVIVLALTLVLLTILGAVGFSMLQKRQNDESLKKVSVGIVGDKNDKILKMGIDLLKTIDTSSFSVEFTSFDNEDTAVSAIESGSIDTYVFVPKDFGKLLWRGKEAKLTYVMAKSGAGMGTLLTRDILKVVSNYIVKTQAGATAMCDYAEGKGFSNKQIDDIDLEISIDYIELIVKREEMADITEIGLGSSLSMIGYYICGFTVFFLLCFGITCSPLKIKKDNTLDKLLYSRGCGAFCQITAEYVPYFTISLITLIIPFFAVGIASNYMEFGVTELKYLLFGDYVFMPFKLIPVILLITAFQFLLYELVSGVISSVLLQFTVSVVLGYISGCFYPISFLPAAVQGVSAILPVGVAIDYFGAVLTQSLSLANLALCLLYAALLFGAAVAVRKFKIQKLEGQ